MEYQKNEIIEDFMVWRLGAVLAKYLDLYWVSDMGIYLDNLLACGSKVKSRKAAMVIYLMVYHLFFLNHFGGKFRS